MLRRYNSKDYEMVKSWYEARSLPVPTHDALDARGAIVPDVAAGFLHIADGGVALLEHFVAKPGLDKDTRNEALNNITNFLISEAKELGASVLFIATKNVSIVSRAKAHGFRIQPHVFMTRSL